MADINRRAVLIAAAGAVVPAEIPISAAPITSFGCIDGGVLRAGSELVPAARYFVNVVPVALPWPVDLIHEFHLLQDLMDGETHDGFPEAAT